MALGKRLVAEYSLEPGVDTLGRWMVHHIAELIQDAEVADATDLGERRALAVNTILSFWAHRRSLDPIDPLKDLKPILKVIRTLDPDKNRWAFGRNASPLSDLYAAVRQIIIFALFANHGKVYAQDESNQFLSEDEKSIIATFNAWLADYQKAALKTKPKRRTKEEKAEENGFDIKEHLLKDISQAREALDSLERQLNGLD